MTVFRALLALDVAHGYYAGGLCRGLEIAPTAPTARLFERVPCAFRSTGSGFLLHADADRVRMFTDDGPLELDFVARTRDPAFAAVTEGASHDAAAALLFEHAPTPASGPTGARLPGRLEPLASSAWAALLPARARASAPAFGLRIALAEPAPQRLEVRLEARALPWKYYFVGAWDREGLYVADAEGAVTFSTPAIEHLSDGRAVLGVMSTSAIPMAERPGRRFQLRCRADGADRVVVKHLPQPAVGQWGLQPSPGGGLVSEIYVNR